MIFEPAFSTAQEVSSVSGRGVGMDAVRSVVDNLRGSIDIRTQRGVGTSVTFRFPVTLAIIDGLLVRVGKSTFILPL
jgi:two-component system chemotaxis sensor kinase CheA